MWLVWTLRLIGIAGGIGVGILIVYELVYETLGRWMK